MSNKNRFTIGVISLCALVKSQTSAPTPVEVTVGTDLMASVTGTFQTQSIPKMNLDNNVSTNMLFLDTCTQSLLIFGATCTGSPTNVITSLPEASLADAGDNFTANL